MDKQVILAKAGSGKTYYICNTLDPEKKNLVLAFTHENINNILSELVKTYGKIPNLTTVMTFDAFMYRLLLKPYETSVLSNFDCTINRGKGITMINPPEKTCKKNNRVVNNPAYITQDKIGHYMTKTGYYYCSRLSELLMKSKIGKEKLVVHAAKQINLFFDYVYIDEFQDYRMNDYEIMINLSKNIDNILLVGDYYQHSVSGTNNTGKPFLNKSNPVSYADFVKSLQKNSFVVDDKSLVYSRRCSNEICDFIREKLGIEIYGNSERKGKMIFVEDVDKAKEIIQDDNIIKLVYKNASIYPFKAVNWSYSKGDTMKITCVILTKTTDFIIDGSQLIQNISPITRNKLYVALTRSTSDVYVISSSLFKQI